jgi:protein phosphatase
MPLTIDVEGLSDVGKVREKNEDQFLIAELEKAMVIRRTTLERDSQTQLSDAMTGHLLVVADGMGGHADGEVASELATVTVTRYVLGMLPWFHGVAGRREEDVTADLIRALKRCESVVQTAADEQTQARRMGTTLTMVYLNFPDVFVVNVGDSRCYLQRGSELHQVTVDQTAAQEMLEQGVFDSEEVVDSTLRSALSQAIGGAEHGVQPDAYVVKVEPADTILLCTDGLSDYVPEKTIAGILAPDEPADAKCSNLVAAANDAGGSDNITAIVARVLEMGA